MNPFRSTTLAPLLFVALLVSGCPQDRVPGSDAGPNDAGRVINRDGGQFPDGGAPACDTIPSGPCGLPGSWVHDPRATNDDPKVCYVPGGATAPHFEWLQIPEGYCVHSFAKVPNVRQLRFAPGGELFAASPTAGTTGGGAHGLQSIVVLPDDDSDGVADSTITYRTGLPSTQGLLFANDYFYYQDGVSILREPYTTGQRMGTGTPETVMTVNVYFSALHWPKTLDISDEGRIFVTNGGDQSEACEEPSGTAQSMPFHGGILELEGSLNGKPIAKGLRNPIDIKCHRDGHHWCFATELALDYSASKRGREKLIPVRENSPIDNWGFPCCASKSLPYLGVTIPCLANPAQDCTPDCTTVAEENVSWLIGDTPFGFDFVDDQFPSPWNNKVIIALHGAAGSWFGARVVAVDMDPATGLPLDGTNVDGVNTGHMVDFMTGWDNGRLDHGRPADIAMSPDGRIFVANDNNGEILWVAPVTVP